MGRALRYVFSFALIGFTSLVGFGATATGALAGPYTQLQVLLPGETPAPGAGSGKLGTPDAQTVGIPFTITVRACDSNWDTVPTVTDVVSTTASDATAGLPGAVSLVNGTIDLQVTMNAAGSFTVSATDDSDPTIPMATSALVPVQLLQSFDFSRINQKNQNAGVPMTLTVTAVDPSGNVVTGYSGPASLDEITSFGVGRIEPAVVTLSSGQWTGGVTMYRADETSINRGNVNVYAYLASNPAVNGTSDPFTVHPGPFSHVQIVVPGESPAPGSVSGVTGSAATQSAAQAFTVDIFATDDYWNPLPSNDAVRVTSSDPAASTPVSGGMVNGFAQFTLSLGTVGTQTLTVVDQTNSAIQGMTSPGIPVIAAAPDHFEVDPISSPITAGANVAVTIRATDVIGNTITNYSGNATLSANTGPGSITPEAIVFVNGVWSGNMVFRGAGGAVSFTCADFSAPPNFGTSNNFQVLAGPFVGLQALLPGQSPAGGTSSGFTGTPASHNAGSSFNVTVRAVDQFWNRVTGVGDRFSLTSTDSFGSMPSDTSLVNGELVFPITIFKAGFQNVTATDLDNTLINPYTSSDVEIIGGAYSRILLLAPGEVIAYGTVDGRGGAATDQSINFLFTLTVYATDDWWNPVGGATDVVAITSGDPLAQLPADQAMVDGVASMTIRLSTGGFQQITASNVTQTLMPVSTTQVRAISSGFHLEADIMPTAVQAGEPFTLTVKVTNDAGSVIQEINSLVTIEVQHSSTGNPGQGTLLTTQFQLLSGQRSISETYTFAEPVILIARDDAGNDPAVTPVLTVSPGPPSAIELTSNPAWLGGNRTAIVSAKCVDQFGNGVPGEPVVHSLVSGLGTLTQIDSLTDVGGVSTAEFLSPRRNDISRVRAVSNLLSSELDIETALVDPAVAGGFVTNYPNPFHPNELPTTIAYKLSDNATVTMRIFTLSGALVLLREFPIGTPGGIVGLNEVQWDGRNGDGMEVASGGYILVIQAQGSGETLHTMRRKIAVVR